LYGLNTKETDQELFHEQVRTVCNCDIQSLELLAQFAPLTERTDTDIYIRTIRRLTPKMIHGATSKNRSHSNTSSTMRSSKSTISMWSVVTQRLRPSAPRKPRQTILAHCKHIVMLHFKSSCDLIINQLTTQDSKSLVPWFAVIEELKLTAVKPV
jgi:hypothetical protein